MLYYFHQCVYMIPVLGKVLDTELPPFGGELVIRITKCSFCIFNVCNFGYFPLCLGGGTLILTEAVPGLCLATVL